MGNTLAMRRGCVRTFFFGAHIPHYPPGTYPRTTFLADLHAARVLWEAMDLAATLRKDIVQGPSQAAEEVLYHAICGVFAIAVVLSADDRQAFRLLAPPVRRFNSRIIHMLWSGVIPKGLNTVEIFLVEAICFWCGAPRGDASGAVFYRGLINYSRHITHPNASFDTIRSYSDIRAAAIACCLPHIMGDIPLD
jgi:hypothetical protein